MQKFIALTIFGFWEQNETQRRQLAELPAKV